jgi:ABC-type glycerol-3-phosphate transport system permease component
MRISRKNFQLVTTYVGLLVFFLIAVFPVLYVILLALQTKHEASAIPPTIIPKSPQWINFLHVAERIPIAKYFSNSLIFSITTTLMVIVTSVMAAYATTKLRIPGRRFIVALFMGGILIPPAVRTIPLYTMIARIGWVDTWAGLSLPLMSTGFALFFMHQYLLTIPDTIVEAARIDGCSEPQILLRIITPLSIPGIITLALYNFLFRWNGYLWPLVATRKKWTTLPVGIAVFKTSEQLITWNLIAAAAVITLIPVLLLFLALGGRIIKGLALQATK